MEIFKHIAQSPVLFADVRHYFEEENLLDLCNSGDSCDVFRREIDESGRDSQEVVFFPEELLLPAGGAAVQTLCSPGVESTSPGWPDRTDS